MQLWPGILADGKEPHGVRPPFQGKKEAPCSGRCCSNKWSLRVVWSKYTMNPYKSLPNRERAAKPVSKVPFDASHEADMGKGGTAQVLESGDHVH